MLTFTLAEKRYEQECNQEKLDNCFELQHSLLSLLEYEVPLRDGNEDLMILHTINSSEVGI